MQVFTLEGCRGGDLSDGPRPTASPVMETEPLPTPTPEPTPAPDPIGERVRAMTVEELVGQLLVAGIEGKEPGGDAMQIIEELHVGGIILFGRNVEDAEQLTRLTGALKELNRKAENVPLFLCVDVEGGMVSRMPPEVADLPNAYDYAQAGGDFYKRGTVLAEECAAFGFHVDFAPVLDVWSNPNNTVIGKRAFHSTPLEATIAGTGCTYSMMNAGVIPVVKHFPGHGDTDTDSHVGLPMVGKTVEELEDQELMPFRFAIEGAEWKPPVEREPTPVPAVMVGHILLTQIDPLLPSSLSPTVVEGLLREELGFDGVVFTDDLTMGAITNAWGVGEAAVLAVEAGCDVALVCHGLEEVKEAQAALLEAVESGRISMSRLDDSVRRILALKRNEAYAVNDEAVAEPDLEGLNTLIKESLTPAS